MRSQRDGMVGRLIRVIPTGLLGGWLLGCDTPPDIQPMSPPGAPAPRKSPDEEAAAAQGEIPAPAVVKTAVDPKAAAVEPAPPTGKGETKTTARGVKYETLKEGTGPELKPGDAADFLYEGRLENGTVFDGNMKKGEPINYSLGGMIQGWQEGLPGMKVGERRRLTIPPQMGYGAAGHPPQIPANATLIFDVELVKISGR